MPWPTTAAFDAGVPSLLASADMHAEVSLHIDAEPLQVWELVSDITRMGDYSPEVFEAEWLDGATGPAVGVGTAVT